eukprot:jgi/Mesen1/7303/ME000374S06663
MRAPSSSGTKCLGPMRDQTKEVSYSYVLMVQHLIERCLLLYMDRDECARALAKYARVKPVITSTVWNELEKENKEFFKQYATHRTDHKARSFDRLLEDATAKLCAQKLSECSEMLRGSLKGNRPCGPSHKSTVIVSSQPIVPLTTAPTSHAAAC